MHKYKKVIIILLTFLIAVSLLCAILLYNGIIWFNNPSEKDYPIRGIDVSAYQGEIDWNTFNNKNIDFAFIKATEGSFTVDDNFKLNFDQAKNTDIKIGAYHFFSFESSGKTQSQNFIRTVPKVSGMIPPVVDIELYGKFKKNLPSKQTVQSELQIVFDELENYYGVKPIIYSTERTYNLYLKDNYKEYPLWIRNVYLKPNKYEWMFWQYSDHGRLKGFNGKEKFIDMNVFNGNREEFEQLLIK